VEGTPLQVPTVEEITQALEDSMMSREDTRELFESCKDWRVLGAGTYGSAYNVTMPDGEQVAIKVCLSVPAASQSSSKASHQGFSC
jgi:hypothetical protein